VAEPLPLPRPPRAPQETTRAVRSVLGRTRANCLVRSLVLQAWFTEQGDPCDVIIGVTPPSDGFRAHAWLDRPGDIDSDGFTELHRIPPAAHPRRAQTVSAA
jgi:hypothetical protein